MSTICAISTPLGVGGISIIRLSGTSAIDIADVLFCAKNKTPKSFKSNMLELGRFKYKDFEETCMCVVFRAPRSFTGENIVEFQVHGGILIANKVINACIKSGAVLADKGEFSKRAFLNGKASLDQLEGMIDLINSESETELKAALLLKDGKLAKRTETCQSIIIDCLSDIDAGIDYPEETETEIEKTKIIRKLKDVEDQLELILKSKQTGLIIKNGVQTLICGKPNVGKSSILNALVGEEKAIVTDIEGTTRDVIEACCVEDGIKFWIKDTAGIRKTENIIEKFGIDKAKKLIKESDLILFVVDQSDELSDEDKEIYELVKDKNTIVVLNKTDKKKCNNAFKNDCVETDCSSGKGIDKLKSLMVEKMHIEKVDNSQVILTNDRHIFAIENAQDNVKDAIVLLNKNETLDLISFHLKNAYEQLGEITGTTTSEEIINSIFSKFCLGK